MYPAVNWQIGKENKRGQLFHIVFYNIYNIIMNTSRAFCLTMVESVIKWRILFAIFVCICCWKFSVYVIHCCLTEFLPCLNPYMQHCFSRRFLCRHCLSIKSLIWKSINHVWYDGMEWGWNKMLISLDFLCIPFPHSFHHTKQMNRMEVGIRVY